MIPMKRLAIRVRLEEPIGEEETARSLLAMVTPAFPAAVVVRRLQSGDVEIYVKNQIVKDYAIQQNDF